MKSLILPILAFILLGTACKETPTTETNKPVEKPQVKQRLSLIDSLNAAIGSNPQDYTSLVKRGKYYFDNNNMQSAGIDINAAFNLDSSNAEIRFLKGKLLLAVNRSRYARNEWETCNKIDPTNTNCRIELAKLYLTVQDYEKALKLVNEVIGIDNQNYQGYYFKGLIVRDLQQDTALALQYFQKSVDLNPDFIEGLDMMGVILASAGDTMAKFYYQRILEIDPQRADVYYKLGVYYMNRDETNAALKSYTKATQLNPNDADSYFNLGFMHIQLKDFSTAKGYFSRAIQTKESNYKAYYGRAYSFEMLGDILNAQKDYRSAIKANPIYDPAKIGLGRVNRIINNQKPK